MEIRMKFYGIAVFIVITMALAGCDNGPAESLGESVDNAAEDLGNVVEDACEEVTNRPC